MTQNKFVSNIAGTSSRGPTSRSPGAAYPVFPACETPALFTSASRRPISFRMRSAAQAFSAAGGSPLISYSSGASDLPFVRYLCRSACIASEQPLRTHERASDSGSNPLATLALA
jgi:hypothetical protein